MRMCPAVVSRPLLQKSATLWAHPDVAYSLHARLRLSPSHGHIRRLASRSACLLTPCKVTDRRFGRTCWIYHKGWRTQELSERSIYVVNYTASHSFHRQRLDSSSDRTNLSTGIWGWWWKNGEKGYNSNDDIMMMMTIMMTTTIIIIIIIIILLQLGCHPVGVVILHVNKTWNWLLINLSREGYMRIM